MNCKVGMHSLIPMKKEGESFGMILRWPHKCEFKVKVIYTNQERGWLVQSGA
jgi:hypothetical protein